jgi:hypothetical protein
MNGQPETAVFVDLENIYIGFRHLYGRDLTADELVERARAFGGVKFINVYADFSELTYPEHFKLALDNEGVHAINVPKDRDREGRPTKNKIDMRMAVDVMRTLAFRKRSLATSCSPGIRSSLMSSTWPATTSARK